MKPLLALFTAAAFGLPALASADTVFKWVDANGVTNYTTTPPPPSVRKVAAIDASPSILSPVPASSGVEEALYWRERRQRELANDISAQRSRQENDDLRAQIARQRLASAYDEDQRRRAEDARAQAAYNQCMLERRIDCYGYGDSGTYGYPVAVIGRRPFTVPGTQSLPGQPSLSTPTPGAPHIILPPRPVSTPTLVAPRRTN